MSDAALADFFTDASDAVIQIAENVDTLASQFRRHQLKQANDGLALLTKDLVQFVVMVDVLRGPLGIQAEELEVDGVSLDDQITRLAGWLELLIEAQRNEDWVTIADILELDLQPVLRAWGPKLLEYTPPPPTAA